VVTGRDGSAFSVGYPRFLCVGARKAGTTWLWANLRAHPQVWLPPHKEIHHLDRRPPTLADRLLGRHRHLRNARRHLRATFLAQWRHWSPDELRWAARHCLLPRSDAWYRSLFPDDDGLMTGEVCPGYARLSLERIAHLARHAPDLKVIYLVRDPVEAAWSSACARFAKKHGGIAGADPGTVERYLRSEDSVQRYDYARNLLHWRTFFPDERIFLGYYDDLVAEPRDALVRILNFLGLDSGDGCIQADVAVPRGAHAGRRVAMAERHRRLLARLFVDRIGVLHHLRPHPYSERWLADARSWAAAGGARVAPGRAAVWTLGAVPERAGPVLRSRPGAARPAPRGAG
jgi:Sulfotransferase family